MHCGDHVDNDHQSMCAVRDGDIDRLGDLFTHHHGRLVTFFLGLTGDSDASEDMAQEVFLRMLKYRGSYRDDSMFNAWMFSIARNVRFDHFRKNGGKINFVEMDETVPDKGRLPDEHCLRGEEEDLLHAALNSLPEDRREVLMLSKIKEMPYRDIAAVVGVSVGAVRVKVCRALKDLTESYNRLAGEIKP